MIESMSHRCETCGVKDGHEIGCAENLPTEFAEFAAYLDGHPPMEKREVSVRMIRAVADRLASVSSASAEGGVYSSAPTELLSECVRLAMQHAPTPEPVPPTNQAGEVEDPAKIALDAYNQGYRDGCEDSGAEADMEPARDGFHDWLHDYKMPEPGNTFAIDLPSNEGRAEVRKQDDDNWQVFVVSENAFDGGYRSAWNLPTFEAAVRNIMDVLWEGCLPLDAPALATQPATSQEGEAMALIRGMAEYAPHVMPAQHGKTVCDDYSRAAILAATPTPPTLSEDLREALREIRDTTTAVAGLDLHQTEEYYRSIARAALAQVKASTNEGNRS